MSGETVAAMLMDEGIRRVGQRDDVESFAVSAAKREGGPIILSAQMRGGRSVVQTVDEVDLVFFTPEYICDRMLGEMIEKIEEVGS